MPAQQRLGSDEEEAPGGPWQGPAEDGEHQPVTPMPASPLRGAAQHAELVPQGEQLDLASCSVPAPNENQFEQQRDELVEDRE